MKRPNKHPNSGSNLSFGIRSSLPSVSSESGYGSPRDVGSEASGSVASQSQRDISTLNSSRSSSLSKAPSEAVTLAQKLEREKQAFLLTQQLMNRLLNELEGNNGELSTVLSSPNFLDASSEQAVQENLEQLKRLVLKSTNQIRERRESVKKAVNMVDVLRSDFKAAVNSLVESQCGLELARENLEKSYNESLEKNSKLQKKYKQSKKAAKEEKRNAEKRQAEAFSSANDRKERELEERKRHLDRREESIIEQRENLEKTMEKLNALKEKLTARKAMVEMLEKAQKNKESMKTQYRVLQSKQAKLSEDWRKLKQEKKKIRAYQAEYFGYYDQSGLIGRVGTPLFDILREHKDIARLIKSTDYPMSREKAIEILRIILNTCDPETREKLKRGKQTAVSELKTELVRLAGLLEHEATQQLITRSYSPPELQEKNHLLSQHYQRARAALDKNDFEAASGQVGEYEKAVYALLYGAGEKLQQLKTQNQDNIDALQKEKEASEKQIADHKEAMDQKDAELSQAIKEVRDKQTAINELVDDLEAREDALEKNAQKFQEGFSQAGQLLIQKNDKIGKLEAQLSDLNERLKQTKQNEEAMQKQVEELTSQLNVSKQSFEKTEQLQTDNTQLQNNVQILNNQVITLTQMVAMLMGSMGLQNAPAMQPVSPFSMNTNNPFVSATGINFFQPPQPQAPSPSPLDASSLAVKNNFPAQP